MAGLICGIDSGGTKTIAWLADIHGHVLGRGASGSSNYQVVGLEAAQTALFQSIQRSFEVAGLPQQKLAALGLGLAGCDRPEDKEWVETWVNQHGLAEKLAVVNDAHLLLWAGTPKGWGIGLISGTGAIAIGSTAEGTTARSSGWGWLLGDEGSGYAISVEILHCITRSVDRRGPSTSLLPRVLDFWDLTHPADLISKVYRSDTTRADIAQLAVFMLEEADRGDAMAVQIENQAAEDLALAVVSVAHQLDFRGEIPFAMGGGVLTHNPRLCTQIIARVHHAGFNLNPVEKVTEPVRGALRLAMDLI